MAADKELSAIVRIMATMQTLGPVERTRVLDYITSRIESMGSTPPAPAGEDDGPVLTFPDAETRRAAS